jgi:hypothetical protein
VSAEQGVESVFPQVFMQGCLFQDIADMTNSEKADALVHLIGLGIAVVIIPGVFGSQSPLFPLHEGDGERLRLHRVIRRSRLLWRL